MKQSLFDLLFGKLGLPNRSKGLKEKPSLKPSLHFGTEGDFSIPYRLVRAKRKSVGFIIDERGLTIRAPRWVSRDEIEAMIYEREDWIREKLNEFSQWQSKKKASEIAMVNGAQVAYLGGKLTLRLATGATKSVLVGDELLIKRPLTEGEELIEACVIKWFKNEARRYLGARLEAMAAKAGLTFESWKLSGAKGRWGCCTSARTIRLNWRLIHLEPALIDYVIAHELAHLDEMNHGPRFWSRVADLCPDYESRRRRLKSIAIS